MEQALALVSNVSSETLLKECLENAWHFRRTSLEMFQRQVKQLGVVHEKIIGSRPRARS